MEVVPLKIKDRSKTFVERNSRQYDLLIHGEPERKGLRFEGVPGSGGGSSGSSGCGSLHRQNGHQRRGPVSTASDCEISVWINKTCFLEGRQEVQVKVFK